MLYIGTTDRAETARVRSCLEERGLTSHMNDSKWRALCLAIAEELPFAPAYQSKLVLSDRPEPSVLEDAPWYCGDWARTPEAGLGIFIEWLKVAPRRSVTIGRLVPPRIEDCSVSLIAILQRLHIPFREEDGFVVIFGHSANGCILESTAPE